MRRERQLGYVLIFTAFLLTTLLAFMAFGIDMGMLRYYRRVQQTAADAAAIAGANALAWEGASSVATAAQNAAAANGFGNGGNVTVTVNYVGTTCNGPCAGPHTGNVDYVEAIVTATHATILAPIVKIYNETVAARAVATYVSGGSDSSSCIVTLGPPANEIGVDTQGSITLNATQCGIEDNGNFNPTGAGFTINTCSFTVSGAPASGPGANNIYCGTGTLTPTYNGPTAQNPLSALDSQTPCDLGYACTGGPNVTNSTSGCTGGASICCPGGAAVCNFSTITINQNTTFAPGIYVIDGGGTTGNPGFNCTGSPNISGTGVLFFFTGAATITCTGDGVMNLTAPSNLSSPFADYNGILMWEDPNDTSTGDINKNGNSCAGGKGNNNLGPSLGGNTGGNGTSNGFNGILYFPADQLWFFGNTHGSVNGLNVAAAVSDSLCMTGNADINFVGASSLPGPLISRLSNTVLVE